MIASEKDINILKKGILVMLDLVRLRKFLDEIKDKFKTEGINLINDRAC